MSYRLQHLSQIMNPFPFRFTAFGDPLKCGVPTHEADHSEKGVVLIPSGQARFRQHCQGGFHPRKLVWTHEAMTG